MGHDYNDAEYDDDDYDEYDDVPEYCEADVKDGVCMSQTFRADGYCMNVRNHI